MTNQRHQLLFGEAGRTSSKREQASPPNSKILADLEIEPFLKNELAFESAIMLLIGNAAKVPWFCTTAYRLFPLLALSMDPSTGHCYPGVGTLAKALGVSVQAIRNARSELEYAGLIFVERQSSMLQTNNYYIDFRRLDAVDVTRLLAVKNTYPETNASPSLINTIFGETNVAGLSEDDKAVLQLGLERSNSYA